MRGGGGTDPGDDVAVLRLSGAAGLPTARIATAAQVAVGDAVTAVGNAGGKGGTPTAASGHVVALARDITASDENGTDAERLTGLIQVDAAVQAGDSGGPLYADGAVIGIDTAASTSGRGRVATTAAADGLGGLRHPDRDGHGDRRTDRRRRAEQHDPPGRARLPRRATADGAAGTTVSGVVRGSPAAAAGLRAGDTITAVGGAAIDRPDALSDALAGHRPQDRVAVAWTDTAGASHTATVTLATGPAD